MAEYIEKNQVIEWFRPYGQTDEAIPHDVLVNDIREMAAADVEQVTRCKDCRYFKMYKCRMGYSNHDDFCSYGEKRA